MTDWLARLREAVESGDEERFQRAMDWVQENRSRPRMPTTYERQLRDERPKGEPDWSTWRCPQCGTVQASSECGYCRRQAVVSG